MPSLQANPTRKKPKKAFKGCCGYCGEFGHKAAECPNKKYQTKNKGLKEKSEHKKKQSSKGDQKERDIRICQKLNVLILVNMDIMHVIVQIT